MDKYEYNNQGVYLNKSGKYSEALTSLNQALTLDPNYAKAWFNLGLSMDGLDRYEEAISCFNRALDLDPEYVKAWVNRGDSLRKLKRYDEAIENLIRALELDAINGFALETMAITLVECAKYAEAVEVLKKALKISPDRPDLLYNLAVAQDALKKYRKAVHTYHQFMAVAGSAYPQHVDYARSRIAFLEQLLDQADDHKRQKQSIPHTNSQLSLGPCPSGYGAATLAELLDKGINLKNQGDFRRAIDVINQVLQGNPDSTDALNIKAFCHMNLQNWREAIVCLNKSLQIKPRDDTSWANKATCQVSLGNYQEGLACLEKALAIRPSFDILFQKAYIEDTLGMIDKAVDTYQRFLYLCPVEYQDQINYARARLFQIKARI